MNALARTDRKEHCSVKLLRLITLFLEPVSYAQISKNGKLRVCVQNDATFGAHTSWGQCRLSWHEPLSWLSRYVCVCLMTLLKVHKWQPRMVRLVISNEQKNSLHGRNRGLETSSIKFWDWINISAYVCVRHFWEKVFQIRNVLRLAYIINVS
jgi:hypothetical protein